MKLRFPKLAYNLVTFMGATIALIAAIMMVFFLFVRSAAHDANPYLGILVYMVLPPALFLGLVLIPVGMIRTKKRIERQGEHIPRWPILDLARPTHRNAFFVFVFGTTLFVLISVVGGYQAFHFTESVEFCGTTCHAVMKPEHVAYQNSPHARVRCVQCHVGPGADFYAKSKLSGAYQVYAVARNIYPRPIPTPIHNLRPAQEVCEQCHWPEKFFPAQMKRLEHFMYDDDNTHWPITLMIKTGGGQPELGTASGIHWHMNISMLVEYIARDEMRQDIPWVRITNRQSGEVTVYQNQDDPLTEEEIAAETPRVMDCVDCHNRPSHNYHSPDYLVDRAIAGGHIDRTLPEIKRVSVEAMDGNFDTEDEALESIRETIAAFYREEYPEVFESEAAEIARAADAVCDAYAKNMFPEMKVKWDVYPDNIGHMIFAGCMRCHAGTHETEDGRQITRDCNSCHTILMQGANEYAEVAPSEDGLEFNHPDGDDDWRDTGCYECHSGVQP